MIQHQQHGRHTRPRTHHWVAGAAAVAIMIVIVIALGNTQNGNGDDGSRDSPVSQTSPTSPAASARSASASASTSATTSSAGARAEAAAASCRDRWKSQSAPLGAASTSMDQWRLHIQAMNQLVAGTISLDQATAFWEQTRVAAGAHVHRFLHADKGYAGSAQRCRRPPAAMVDASTIGPELSSCVAATKARDGVLGRARVALATWKNHIRDMELFRAGKLSATQAGQMWVMNWHKGAREVKAYDVARRQTARMRCCC